MTARADRFDQIRANQREKARKEKRALKLKKRAERRAAKRKQQ